RVVAQAEKLLHPEAEDVLQASLPMLALAACSCDSASRTSGRWRASSEGRDSGRSAGSFNSARSTSCSVNSAGVRPASVASRCPAWSNRCRGGRREFLARGADPGIELRIEHAVPGAQARLALTQARLRRLQTRVVGDGLLDQRVDLRRVERPPPVRRYLCPRVESLRLAVGGYRGGRERLRRVALDLRRLRAHEIGSHGASGDEHEARRPPARRAKDPCLLHLSLSVWDGNAQRCDRSGPAVCLRTEPIAYCCGCPIYTSTN